MHLRKRVDVTTIPVPKIVPTSGRFDGNDGKWSTFLINVNSDTTGQNGQDFRVLPYTSSGLTLLPLQTDWCTTSECIDRRGIIPVGGNQVKGLQADSPNWVDFQILNIPLPYWYSESRDFLPNATDPPRGQWGTTKVGLGQSSAQSLVNPDLFAVGYVDEAFFLGSFGLSVGDVGTQGATKPTFLSRFKELNAIPSASYGYTAGAWYRKFPALCSALRFLG